MNQKWFVYIVECSDKSLYTGISVDVTRRISEHNTDNTKGAKSLRSKRPVKLVFIEEFKSQSDALKREYAIKNWKRKYKLQLICRKISGFTP